MKKHDKKHEKHDPIKHETEYVELLKKRLNSDHFKENSTEAEIEMTKKKYDKAKLKLRMLTGKM